MDLIRAEQDPARRIAYINQAEQILVEDDAAVIPLYFNDRVSLVKPDFTTAFGIVPYFEQWDQATVYYVTPDGAGNCSSWETACSLQTALTAADSGDEIWVAAGTYKPTTGSDRNATFQLKDGVAIYGGFNGTETAREQRDFTANVTILSGDIGTLGINSDNSVHVVTGANNAILDGFTVTAGYSDGASCPGDLCGAGMYNFSSSPTITNVNFSGNEAKQGSGMYNYASNPTLTNVTFSGNGSGIARIGGGMVNDNSNPTLTNVTFSGNVVSGSLEEWTTSKAAQHCRMSPLLITRRTRAAEWGTRLAVTLH